MFLPLFFLFSISDPIYFISASTCTIKGDGIIDKNSYRTSGSYTKYTVITIGKEIRIDGTLR